MAVTFRFDSADTIVTTYLSATEIAQVPYWQASYDYDLEFHTGHTTGYPIYVRPSGNKDKSNLPKFDTLNKSASDYTAITDFANGTKLRQVLRNTAQQDLLNLVSQSWNYLSLLAQRYWTRTVPTTVVATVTATTKACNVPTCNGTVPIVTSGKAACDTCFKYQ